MGSTMPVRGTLEKANSGGPFDQSSTCQDMDYLNGILTGGEQARQPAGSEIVRPAAAPEQ